MADYVPQSDALFDSWQSNLMTYLLANLIGLGLVAGDSDVVAATAAQTTWTTAYPDHVAAQAAAEAASATKEAARTAYVEVLRRLVQRLQNMTSVSDAERQALGIRVRDTDPTAVSAPTTRPVLSADTRQRLRITLSFADEGTPTAKAKPAGVIACEIWMKVGGPPPTDLSECVFLAVDTRTPYVATFEGSDANQTAHFIGMWVSTRGEKGPLSETVSATITG